MTRRTLLSVAVLLISTAACSSESSGGTSGVGEKLEDLQTFSAREFAQALVG